MVPSSTPTLLLLFAANFYIVSGITNSEDAAVLRSLTDQWKNTPPSWRKSDDPCDSQWEGVTCNNSRVTALRLSTMGLKGTISGDIGQLTELQSLDLSFNKDLTGPISPTIGNLKKLTILILAGCSFSGKIPDELGNLEQLSFLALNSNKFIGGIPPSLGKLSNLYWLDLAGNQLTGSLPVSTDTTPGMDQLLNAKHFHLSNNKLSGSIPPSLFNSEMVLIHILFDGNKLTGRIPSQLGLVQSLEVLRLDRNSLSGTVPSTLSNLTRINELHLANNQLTGPIPDLMAMSSLNYVDMSNNFFDPSEAPTWFSNVESLTTLVIENGSLHGQIPEKLFSFPQLQYVKLKNNSFNGTLDMGENVSQQLQLVDLETNDISAITLGSRYSNTLELYGNPVCTQLTNLKYCQLQQPQEKSYSTSLARCGTTYCGIDRKLNPQSCDCAYPYEGTLYFRAPLFGDVSNNSTFLQLEMRLWTVLGLTPGSVSLQNPFFNVDGYLQVHLELFPPYGMYFNRTEIQRIGFDLTNQTFKPPHEFGPYFFIASPYIFPDETRRTSISAGVIIAIAVSCAVLVLVLTGVGIYAFMQKKRAERAIRLSRPFASWAPTGKDSGGAPQLKGARWFSHDELRKSTSNFSESNEIGSGGYGKGYLDPEYYITQQLTEKSDVYSFGVVMLELITAKQPIEKGKYVVREVRMAMTRNEEFYGLKEMMDPAIQNANNLIGFERFVELAMQCVEESAADRPTMSEVVKEIETILQNDGMNTSSTSASSSATDFGSTKGASRHPYNEPLPKKDVNSSSFDYSGGYALSVKIEPK
ncbi:hypothetical protein MRB53_033131 [Persea americana]|uniref:Uncharacterized protein n=1 Tax=Persea americana TaxID=3435 RepID=A0ACC2KTW6_PERAE|nr:hypothetical protein MRB53_033131 [Persea americana]